MSSDTCNATTADGTPCENSACRSDGRCWIHTETSDNADATRLKLNQEISDLIIEEIEHGATVSEELGKRDERKSIKQQAIENDDVRLLWKIHMKQYGDEYADEQTETKSPPFALPEDVIDKWQHTDTQA